MTKQSPSRSKNNVSALIGLWLGLTAVAGLSVFALFYWALGGFERAQPTPIVVAATANPTATLAAPAIDTPEPGGKTVTTGCEYPPAPASGFGYGIQSHVFVGDNSYFLTVVRDQLGLYWVKVQARWADMEHTPGDIDWGILDNVMEVACAKGLRVMLSVLAAPEWTHANPMPAPEGQEAPPDDYSLYAAFVGKIVDRYPGQVGAIEVWNEMNLEREWNTAAGISPADYVQLLRLTHTAIKAKDPNIIVIMGAPAPTGINCNVSFPNCQPAGRTIIMDDVTYLTEFVRAGGLAFADCIGTHSNGTNLPPTADGANPPDGTGYTFRGPWDTPHYSWALRSQVETYARILNGRKPQCVTEFGYASAVEGQYPPHFGFAADVTEEQQAEYLVQAFDWMRESGQVQLAFLFNLDYGPKGGDPSVDDNVIFSILTRQGAPRPAFDAIARMPKP